MPWKPSSGRQNDIFIETDEKQNRTIYFQCWDDDGDDETIRTVRHT